MDLEQQGQAELSGLDVRPASWPFPTAICMSLYDRSDGFYRRQLILTTKRKPPDRADDPELADKLCEELEGIFLWRPSRVCSGW